MDDLFGLDDPILQAGFAASGISTSVVSAPSAGTSVAGSLLSTASAAPVANYGSSTGNYNSAVTNNLPGANATYTTSSSFTIQYNDVTLGAPRYFNFSLPPAIDNILTYSSSGSFRGNASVPDVKPGIPIRTAMKHRNINIPGGTSVVQTIGVDSKYMVLVGAFLGSEQFSTAAMSSIPNQFAPVYSSLSSGAANYGLSTAYTMAKAFDENVVQQGAAVTVTINMNDGVYSENVTATGVVVDFKIQAVRPAKTYYSITLLYTTFPQVTVPQATTTSSNNAVSSTYNQSVASAVAAGVTGSTPAQVAATSTATVSMATTPDAQVIAQEGLVGRTWDSGLLSLLVGTTNGSTQGYGYSFPGWTSAGSNTYTTTLTRPLNTSGGINITVQSNSSGGFTITSATPVGGSIIGL